MLDLATLPESEQRRPAKRQSRRISASSGNDPFANPVDTDFRSFDAVGPHAGSRPERGEAATRGGHQAPKQFHPGDVAIAAAAAMSRRLTGDPRR